MPASAGLFLLWSQILGSRVELRSVPFQSIPRRSGASWSHSGRIIAGHELVGEFGEVAHRHVEGGGDSSNRAPGRVGFTALNQGERFRRDACLRSQSLLGDIALLPQLANRLAQGGLWFGSLAWIAIQDMCLKAARLGPQT